MIGARMNNHRLWRWVGQTFLSAIESGSGGILATQADSNPFGRRRISSTHGFDGRQECLPHQTIFALAALLLCIALTGCDRSSASDAARPPADVPASTQSGPTAFGFTPFPYDMTPEAVDETHRIIRDEATLYALHLDEGIPWNEAFKDEPFPQKVRQQWDDLARRTPKDHAVYVGLAPLAKDRTSLAPAIEGSSVPKELRGNDLDTAAVKKAYLTYARRAVQQFHPDYLNLGIE